jgi:hypothetical protein
MKENQNDREYESSKSARSATQLGRDFSDTNHEFAPMDEYTLAAEDAFEGESRQEHKGLKEEVEELLYLHPEFDDQYVHVAVDEGKVTLMGRVQTKMDKDLAESLVMELAGVVKVINLLEVDISEQWRNPPAGENLSKGLY